MRPVISLIPLFAFACGGNVTLGGPPTLVRVDNEPPGLNCADGGVAIKTGVDKNGNGFLDDTEVTSVQYVCNGPQAIQCNGGTIQSGSVTITSDADLAQLAGVDCVDGDLLISGLSQSDYSPLQLGIVTGDVTLAGNSALTSLGVVGNLHTVGDVYLVQGNPKLTDISTLAQIDHVLNMSIIGNDALVDVNGLAPFTSFTFDVHIADNAGLTSLHGLENLIKTNHSISIESNPRLTSLAALDHLRSVDGILDIEGNPALGAIDLMSLELVGRRLIVNSNSALASFAAPSLATVGAYAQFYDDGALKTLDLPKLVTAGAVYVESDQAIIAVSAPALSSTTSDIELSQLPLLTSVDFSQTTLIGGALTLKTVPALGSLGAFSSVTLIGGALTVDHADLLANFQGLDALGAIEGDMVVTNNMTLSSFTGLGSLTEIGGALTITGNPMLPISVSNAFASRVTVQGKVTIR
jgi:hypothetical protein